MLIFGIKLTNALQQGMNDLINWISATNSNWITILTILVAWLIFRIGVYSERRNVIEGLEKELDLHKNWMGNQYFDGVIPPGSKWNLLNYVVFKLSTIAIDNAIVKGPHLFLNKKLLIALIGYRQMVGQFNQLVEVQQAFQSNTELWEKKQTKLNRLMRDKMLSLTGQIHWYGINNLSNPLGHYYYQSISSEVKNERRTKITLIIWIVTNLNTYWMKKILGYF